LVDLYAGVEFLLTPSTRTEKIIDEFGEFGFVAAGVRNPTPAKAECPKQVKQIPPFVGKVCRKNGAGMLPLTDLVTVQ
jgi:hypothetical protein